jgi:hypothetical protein
VHALCAVLGKAQRTYFSANAWCGGKKKLGNCVLTTITQLQSLAVLYKQDVRNFLAALQEPALGRNRTDLGGRAEKGVFRRQRTVAVAKEPVHAAIAKDPGDELKQAGMQSPERVPDPLRPEALQVFLAAFRGDDLPVL